jgi:uncharacterized membrane protein YhaH (DUF805 family)
MVFLRPLVRYADFKGRARRSEYWGFWIFQSLIGGLCGAMAIASLSNKDISAGATGFLGWIGLACLAAAIFFLPNLAVLVRRLHDTNRSAWWLMLQAPSGLAPLMFFSAFAGIARSGGMISADASTAILAGVGGGMLLLMAAAVCSLILGVFLLLPGTDGENRFGPDPRGSDGFAPDGGSAMIDEERLKALFADARRDGEPAPATDARWKPDLDFGPMNGRAAAQPAPVARQPATGWADVSPGPTFGRRGL